MIIGRKRVLINISSGLFQIAISLLLVSFGVSLFIKNVGIEKYGIFSLIGIIGSLNSFSNLGLSTTLVKHIAEQGICKESTFDFLTALILISFTILPIGALLFYFKYNIFYLIGIPERYNNDINSLYYSLIFSNILLMYGQVFMAVLESQLKLFIVNTVQLIYTMFYWGGIIFIIISGGRNLDNFSGPILFSTILWFLILMFFASKELKISFDKHQFKGYRSEFYHYKDKQLNHSLKVFTSGMIGFFYEPLTKSLVSHLFGLREIAHFDIALRVKGYIVMIFGKFVAPLNGIIANQKKENVSSIVKKYTKYSVFVLFPFAICFYYITPLFIKFWIGQDIEITALYVRVICISHLISIIATPAYYFFMLKGNPLFMALAHLSNVIINLFIILFFHNSLGEKSILIASSCSILISNFILIYFSMKKLKIYE